MRHLSINFCDNQLISFCIILLTNKKTNKQTNKQSENTTSLAEVCDRLKYLYNVSRLVLQEHRTNSPTAETAGLPLTSASGNGSERDPTLVQLTIAEDPLYTKKTQISKLQRSSFCDI